MRILIAEDELLERKAMKKFIQDNFTDMKVVGEAANGRIAIQLAMELQPDIIFMDIKMPGINGLEAIEQIYKAQPMIKFILVSAYDTFEYAKQAMKFGIKDYILKPGKTEEIVKALFRVKKEIIYEANIAEEKRRSAQLLRESFIRKLMQYPVEEDSFGLKEQILSTMESGYFLVFGTNTTIDLQQVREDLENHADHSFIIYETNGMAVVLIMLTEPIKKADQLILARKLHLELGESIFIGIGPVCTSLGHLPASYREAYSACFQLKTENKSNYSFLQANKQDHDRDQIAVQIAQAVEKGDYNEAFISFKENDHHLEVIDKEKLYISIQNILVKRNITGGISSLSLLQTDKDWHTYLNVCCMKMNEYSQSKQSMTIAKEYIADNYPKGITLEDVATLVNLSPNYFSNLFKEEFGETFIELLTRTRMEKAKDFIEENTYSLKEISFMVGYKDPNYFSRVFKRYYHSSPKHFQNSIFEK